jgi:predicted secreted hydrolase
MPRRQDNWIRQRAERLDVGRARQALSVVTPYKARLGDWQVQAARLRVLAERRRAAGENTEEITRAAAMIFEQIENDRRELEHQSAELPPEVAQHSRFQDVVRALATASAAISSVFVAS